MRSPRSFRHGFTIVEVVVVLIILGVIIGIATISWSSITAQVNVNKAGAALDRVVTAEQPLGRDWGSYSAWPADLASIGSDLTILNGGASASPTQISVVVGNSGTLGLAVQVTKTKCLYRTVAPLETGGGQAVPASIPSSSACAGSVALPAADTVLVQTSTVKTVSN